MRRLARATWRFALRTSHFALSLAAAGVLAQPITNPGPQRILIMPGATLQMQGDVIGGPVITPPPSVMNFPIEDNLPPFAIGTFRPAIARVGEQLTFQLVVNCALGDVQLPESLATASGLTLTLGARTQEMITFNNRVRRILAYNYHCTPRKPGVLQLPGFRFVANGMPMAIGESFIEIGDHDDDVAEPQPELTLRVPDRTLYVGETIPVGVTISYAGDRVIQNVTALDITGEGVIVDRDTPFFRQRKTITNRGGKMVVTVETEALVTVLHEGLLTLNAQAEVALDPPEPMPLPLQGYRELIEAKPVPLQPTPVPPAGVLPGFNGAIGRFQMQPVLSANSLFVGEPVTLSVIMQGEGNLRTLAPPAPANADGWKILPAEMDPAITNGNGLVRMFHYTFVPTTADVKVTPKVPFSYFNPATTKYVDLTIPPLPVTVAPVPTNDAAAFVGSPNRPSAAAPPPPEEPEDTLRPLADSRGRTLATLMPWQSQRWFWFAQLAPAAALAGLWLWDRRRRYLAAHPEVVACRAAIRASRRYRHAAETALRNRDRLAFAGAVVGMFREICAPRIGARPESLVSRDIIQLLPARRMDRAEEFISRLFTELDAHRFGSQPPEGTWRPDLACADTLFAGYQADLRTYVSQRVRQRLNGHTFTGSKHAVVHTVVLLTLGLAWSATAQTPDRFRDGVAAYVATNYDSAATAFREAAGEQASSGAFRNLGNAEWQRGHIGEAVLAWERALWIDPFDRNSRVNLRFARKVARLDAPSLTWLETCSSWLPAGWWAAIALAGFWFSAALLVLPYVFHRPKRYWHQFGIAVGLTIFLLTLPALIGVNARSHHGVILADETPVRLTPTAHGETLARLPAGETAMFGRRRGDFLYVQTAGGTAGWVNTNGFRLVAE